MKKTLRLLLVEDSPDDAELIIREIKSAGYDIHHLRVEDEESFRKAVADTNWQVILADYHLPRFSGEAAIQIMQTLDSEIPIIIVSGTTDERKAVESLRAGAKDYVSKNNFMRLVPAIERELADYERRILHSFTERALKKQQATFFTIFEKANTGICTLSLDGKFMSVNPAICTLLAYDSNDLNRKNLREILKWDVATLGELDIHLALANGSLQGEQSWERKDGVAIWVQTNISMVTNSRGEPDFYICHVLDVSAEKESALNLEENRRFLATLIQNLPGPVYRCRNDRQWTTEFFSTQVLELTGYSVLEFMHGDINFGDLIREDFRDTVWESVQDCLKKDRKFILTFPIVAKDGSEKWIWEHGQAIFDSQDNLIYLEGFMMDVTHNIHAQERLRASEERFRTAMDLSPDAITIHDGNLRLYVNENAVKLLGASTAQDLMNMPMSDHFDADDLTDYEVVIENLKRGIGIGETHLWKVKTLDGRRIAVEAKCAAFDLTGTPIIMSIYRDITERLANEEEKRLLESQLIHSQKMDSLGTLASGVAHEINNPLMGIINLAILLDEQIVEEKQRQYAVMIKEEGERIAEIVRDLLSFARKEIRVEPVKIDELLQRTQTLVRPWLRKDSIRLDVDVARDLPQVVCEPARLQQVILNLLNNARDALNQQYPDNHPNKRIIVSAEKRDDESDPLVRISVKDFGPGVPAHLREKIFEPFYTTKGRDKGTGLGLSISYDLIKKNGGNLTLEVQDGHSTIFHIDLPSKTKTVVPTT